MDSIELRKIIQEVLGTGDNILDWALFAEFGSRLLRKIGYDGDERVLFEIKKSFEKEGWKFDDTFDDYLNDKN
jgi:hypothetical protein